MQHIKEFHCAKRLRNALAIAASTLIGSAAYAAAADDHAAHHPAAETTEPATPPPAGSAPSGMMGGRGGGMIGMMGRNRADDTAPGMRGGPFAMPRMGMLDRTEGHIAFLKAELAITNAQNGPWNEFAGALRTNATRLKDLRAAITAMPDTGEAGSLNRTLDVQERWLAARLENTRALKTSLTKLYAALSDDQKKAAEQLLQPYVGGMMMMAMRASLAQ